MRKSPQAPGASWAAREGRSSEPGTPPKVPGDGPDDQKNDFPESLPNADFELEMASGAPPGDFGVLPG